MSSKRRYIDLRTALKNYLKEQGITLSDLLSMMDEDKEGIMDALKKRVHLNERQSRMLEENLTSKQLNLLLFVIQAFYILNPSGLYKDLIIEPTREDVMYGDKVTFEGCKMILEALRISTSGLEDER
ncbi:hypothetical protein DRO37_02545 [Candidatus Bathyarchaeota archaeon]|nr:MAG: hypothetical protein DRO37_02545 [Candidatus Bathyarchaeota archaeon]